MTKTIAKSKLQRIFGNSPHFRVLEHLWLMNKFDYSVADIFDATHVARPTILQILEILISEEVVVKTRQLKNSQRYQFNKDKKEYFFLMNMIIKDAEKSITLDSFKNYVEEQSVDENE